MRALEALGYSYRNNEWVSPDALGAMPLPVILTFEAYAIHGALMRRADAPGESSEEEAELEKIVDLIEA